MVGWGSLLATLHQWGGEASRGSRGRLELDESYLLSSAPPRLHQPHHVPLP